MSNFEFNHIENGEEIVVKYEKKCKLLLDQYISTIKYKCTKCDKEDMNLDQLKDHFINECQAQECKCKFCDITLSRKEFGDANTHKCVERLK